MTNMSGSAATPDTTPAVDLREIDPREESAVDLRDDDADVPGAGVPDLRSAGAGSADSGRDSDRGEALDEDEYGVPPVLAPAAAGLAVLSLAWLAAMLWSGQRAVSFAGAGTMAITSTALALPVVISASLVSGAATGLAVANLLTRRGVLRATPRFAGAVGAALLTGVLAAGAVALGYGDGPTVLVLAGTVAAAVTLGGAAGGLRAAGVVGAVVSAGLAVFAVSLALSLFQDQLLSLYGAGDTRESQLSALDWYSRTVSLASGLAAGAVAFGYLAVAGRRAGLHRAGGGTPLASRWPGYLIGGAGPGLLLLAAEVLTRTAGSRVLTLAGALSEADRAAQSLLGSSRIDHALVVLFTGALTTIILLGRTLGPARDPQDEGSGAATS